MEAREITWRKIWHYKSLYLFIIPTLVLIGLFSYYPASSGIVHSFYRWNGSDISEYVGFANFIDLLTTTEFWQSFKVVLLIGVWNVIKMIPAIATAVCIHRCRSGKLQWIYRAFMVIPMVVPSLIIVLIWRAFFFEATNGYLNKFLYSTGIFDALVWMDKQFDWGGIFVAGVHPAWLGDPNLILPAAIIWGFPWIGSFAVLTYLAKLQGIPKDIYEAAEIDGVNFWSKFKSIELPLIGGSMYLMLVFTIIGTISDAGMVIALAGIEGGPGGKLSVPAVFMLRKAFVDQQMGYACAVGIILTLVVLILQKISKWFMNWESLAAWQQKASRLLAVVCGGWMIFYGEMSFIGILLVLIGIPWGSIKDVIVSFLPTREQERTPVMRCGNVSVFHERTRFITEWFLRGMKHGFIWFIIITALVPMVLMLIVSVKNNQQFYAAPAMITKPFHWENWMTAWKLISPTVANSIYIATASCLATLCLALTAAYFFARYRLPMSGIFWNAILILMMMPMIANLVPLFMLLRDMNLLNTFSALIIVTAASGQIQALFVLREFISDIPQSLFDAAEVDGASHLCQVRNVVLPMSGAILGTIGIMHFVYVWNEFVIALIVMRDAEKLPVTVQLMRLAGEYIKLWGPMMAGYALASIPVIILFMFSMKFFVKGLSEGAVKG